MSKLEDTWGKERLSASVYDAAVQSQLVARVGGLLLWGLDTRKLFAHLRKLKDVTAGTRVLDVPCGGGLTFNVLQPDHGLDYVAFDFSPVMLERAERRARQLGLDGILYQQGDVGQLPYDDASFDLIMSYNGIHCFPDPYQAVQELARVLRPGGRLRVTLVVKGAGWRFDQLIRAFQWRGWFGPTCPKTELEEWLKEEGLVLQESEQSGALWLFEAIKEA